MLCYRDGLMRFGDAPINRGYVRWITANGAHIPLSKKTGKPIGKILDRKKPQEERATTKTPKEFESLHEYNRARGPEFKGVKGRDAVNLLLKRKRGFVRRAFYREGIGYIDLDWGDDRAGIQHILKGRSEKDGLDASDLLRELDDVIKNGKVYRDKDPRNADIWRPKIKGAEGVILKNGIMVVIGKHFRTDGRSIVLTAFYRSRCPKRESLRAS